MEYISALPVSEAYSRTGKCSKSKGDSQGSAMALTWECINSLALPTGAGFVAQGLHI